MASITYRSGKYRALIRRRGHPAISQTFIKRADAITWARKMESEVERGIHLPETQSRSCRFAEVLDRYIRDVLPSKRSGDVMRYRLERIKRSLGASTLTELTPALIARYRDQRSTEVSSAACREELGLIRR